MKITHHKNGLYSITKLTRKDLDLLALALGHAELAYRKTTGWQGAEAWGAKAAKEATSLERILRQATDYTDRDHLPKGKSVTVKSHDGMSDESWQLVDGTAIRPSTIHQELAADELDSV